MGHSHNIGSKQRRRHRKALWEQQKGICHYCNNKMREKGKSNLSASLDHIIPASKGGVNARSNLVLCCMKCNLTKGNACIEEVGKFVEVYNPTKSTDI